MLKKMLNPIRKKKAQSVLEYIIVVTFVIVAILVFSGTFRQGIEDTLNSATNGMVNMADRLRVSRPLSP